MRIIKKIKGSKIAKAWKLEMQGRLHRLGVLLKTFEEDLEEIKVTQAELEDRIKKCGLNHIDLSENETNWLALLDIMTERKIR